MCRFHHEALSFNGYLPVTLMLCVQYRGDTFTAVDATDGIILSESVLW